LSFLAPYANVIWHLDASYHKEETMPAAYVLMGIEAGKVGKALTAIKQIKGVKTAHAVAGPYDVIAYVEAESFELLGQRVLLEFHNVTGIRSTTTAIVFQ